jgi:hypothetical protein
MIAACANFTVHKENADALEQQTGLNNSAAP